MKCLNCNQEHPKGTKFCPEIGKKVPTSFVGSPNRECPNYGNCDIPAHYKFCPECGAKLVIEDVMSDNEDYTFNQCKTISSLEKKCLWTLHTNQLYSILTVGY